MEWALGGDFEERMTRHHFDACDCCENEILPDDPPHYTRPEFERERVDSQGEIAAWSLSRRDLCENCYRRVRQALIQAPESLWLLDEFEVARK